MIATIRIPRNAACGVRWVLVAIIACAGSYVDAGFVTQDTEAVAIMRSACGLPYGLARCSELPGMMAGNEAAEASSIPSVDPVPAGLPPTDGEDSALRFRTDADTGGSQSSSSPGGAGGSVSSVALLAVLGVLPADQLVRRMVAEASALLPPDLPFKLFRPPKLSLTELGRGKTQPMCAVLLCKSFACHSR